MNDASVVLPCARTSEQKSKPGRVSEASNAEQANEWVVQANEQMDEPIWPGTGGTLRVHFIVIQPTFLVVWLSKSDLSIARRRCFVIIHSRYIPDNQQYWLVQLLSRNLGRCPLSSVVHFATTLATALDSPNHEKSIGTKNCQSHAIFSRVNATLYSTVSVHNAAAWFSGSLWFQNCQAWILNCCL